MDAIKLPKIIGALEMPSENGTSAVAKLHRRAGRMANAPERIWARPDPSTVYMDGSSPLTTRDREFRDAVEYVRADLYAALEAQLAETNKALDTALVGLDAGCRQYAVKTIDDAEVPGDEQYPWVRLMMIGRDAARRALQEGGGDGE